MFPLKRLTLLGCPLRIASNAHQVNGNALAQGDSAPPAGETAWPRVADVVMLREGDGVICSVFTYQPTSVGSVGNNPASSKLSLVFKQSLVV